MDIRNCYKNLSNTGRAIYNEANECPHPKISSDDDSEYEDPGSESESTVGDQPPSVTYDSSHSSESHSISDDSFEDNESNARMLSKNIKVAWASTHLRDATKIKQFHEVHGSKIGTCNSIKDSLQLFILKEMKATVIEESNFEGIRRFGEVWRTLDLLEFDAFLGWIEHSGWNTEV